MRMKSERKRKEMPSFLFTREKKRKQNDFMRKSKKIMVALYIFERRVDHVK
jgi:hypothetical protein